jgi:hypothetical protein
MADIGIVGGGIAGLYCAWKLISDKKQTHSVTLYECLNRLGGRIETQDLGGFKAECGPMRFELELEPLFKQLAHDLKIRFGKFSPPQSGSAAFPKYNLGAAEVSPKHKQLVEEFLGVGSHSDIVSGMFSHHTSALDLLRLGIYRMFHDTPEEQKLSLSEVVSGGDDSRFAKFATGLTHDEYDHSNANHLYGDKGLYRKCPAILFALWINNHSSENWMWKSIG